MKILGIESSGLMASAAVVEDGVIRAEFTVGTRLRHSETLLPMVRDMLAMSGLMPDDMDAIAVSRGPGSFTGLRIGIALAKGMALSLNIPLIAVGTLEAMGRPTSLISDRVVCPCMDLRHDEAYMAAYCGGKAVIEDGAYDIGDFLEKLENYRLSQKKATQDINILFLGDGALVYKKVIVDFLSKENAKDNLRKIGFAPAPFNRQRAANVASLGEEYYSKWLINHHFDERIVKSIGTKSIDCFDEIVTDGDKLYPLYFKKSQAERSRISKGISSLK